MLLILRSSDTPIRPRDIESGAGFTQVFDTCESEIAAYWIVCYCQARRSWAPFELDKLMQFCTALENLKFYNYLMEGVGELIIDGFARLEGKVVTLTTGFVGRCYTVAPVAGLPRKRAPTPKSKARSCFERLLDDVDLV